jgi:hypothetical protein
MVVGLIGNIIANFQAIPVTITQPSSSVGGDDPEDLPISTVPTIPQPSLLQHIFPTHMQSHTALTDLSPCRSSTSDSQPPEKAKAH